jgi:hypothetical protein
MYSKLNGAFTRFPEDEQDSLTTHKLIEEGRPYDTTGVAALVALRTTSGLAKLSDSLARQSTFQK